MSKRLGWTVPAIVAGFTALWLFATPAYAVDSDGYFQIDGDVCGGGAITSGGLNCVDTPGPVPPGPADDWDTIFSCTNTQGDCKLTGFGDAAEPPSFIYDPGSLSIFTGGGSKDQSDIPSWLWKDGSVPDKDNIVEAFAAVYKPTAGPRAGHKLLYFGANRFAVDGDAQIGFWFFQNTVTLNGAKGGGGNHFTGKHKAGDILILSNFVKGGGHSNIQVFVVQSVAANGDVTFGTPFGGNDTLGNKACAGGLNNDVACAATNGAITSALDPNFVPKAGAATGQYAVVGFFEGGIDLTEAGPLVGVPNLGGECFGSFMVETRSSQSITAVLKDFALGPFESCSATPSTQIHKGTDHTTDVQNTIIGENSTIHDKMILTAGAGNPAVAGTVTFQFFNNATCTGTPIGTDETKNLVATNPQTNPPTSSAETSGHGPLAAGDYSFLATYNGDDPNYPDLLVAPCETVTVSSPGISITKSCTATHDATTVTVNFSGTVTNSGSEPLKNIVIVDVPASTITTVPPGATTLAIGASLTYSGSYTSTTLANTDTATVDADSATSSGHVSANKPAACSTTVSPSIHVSKTCTTKLVSNDTAGRLVVKDVVSGQVCNTGDVQVTLDSLSDSKAGNIFSSLSKTTLGLAECADYSASYFPTTLSGTNGTASDTVTAHGVGAITSASLTDDEPASCDLCPLGSGGAPNGT